MILECLSRCWSPDQQPLQLKTNYFMIRFDHCTRFVTLTNLNWNQVLANWFVGQANNKGGGDPKRRRIQTNCSTSL